MSGSTTARMSAARAAASASCSAPVSRCRRDSSSGPRPSSASSRRVEAESPVRARIAVARCRTISPRSPRCCERAARRIEAAPLPPRRARMRSRRAHAQALRRDADTPVAVRSSATTEDAADASFAGLQDTYLWVQEPEPDAATRCAAAGRACTRWSRSAIGASAALPEAASPWRSWCRRWWMRAPRE